MGGVMVVPVHLDAVCPDSDVDVAGPAADFRRLPYQDPVTGRDQNGDLPYVSEIMLPQPFEQGAFRLRAGVHLHWALPDGLTRMIQGDDGGASFDAVPNRWLVTRSTGGHVDAEWLIESDFLSQDDPSAITYPVTGPGRPFRGLGRRVPLALWTRTVNPGGYLPTLTAVGYGEPAFAARYADSCTVFGLHDPGFPGIPPKGVTYEVVGWFDDLSQDPAAAWAQAGAGWVAAGQTRYGWTVTDPGDSPPSRTVCYARLTFGGAAPAPGLATAAVPAPGPPGAKPESGVCVGNTATEALAAHLGAVLDGAAADQVEDLLEALAFADDLEATPLDLNARLLEARHGASFHDVQAGTRWTIRRQDDATGDTPQDRQARAGLTVPHQLSDQLNLLNAAQAAVDRAQEDLTALREQLFADWYKYQLCAYPYDSGRDSYPDQDEVRFYLQRTLGFLAGQSARADTLAGQLTAARAIVDAGLAGLNATTAAIRSTYVLQQLPAPAYQLPNEPVILLTGSAATPGDRHGQDGALHPDGLLVCVVSPAEHPAPVDPASVRALRADVAAAVAALPVPNFAVTTWDQPPWHPVLVEWEVEFYPATSGNNLDPRDRAYGDDFITANYTLPPLEVELEPIRTIPDKAANLYAGSTLLSPGARPVMSARVLRYLASSLLPLYLAAGQPAVTPAAFQADPAGVLAWFDAHGDDQRLALLVRIYRHLAANEASNLSAVLGGFNEALLMRKPTRQLPVADPLGFPDYQAFASQVAAVIGDDTRHAPQPLSDFNPIRAGGLRILRLRMVDNFGIGFDVDVSNLQTTTQLRVPGHPDWVAMPPRLAQPARLTVNWLDADDDIQQMNGLPDTAPICGWLVPDNLDAGLAVYSADGTALGTLYALADPAAPGQAQWRAPPGGPGAAIEAIGNPHLRSVAEWLRDQGPGALSAMLDGLNETLRLIEPQDYAQHRGRAVLMGRPVAVARIEVGLELMGWPAVHQDWNVFRQDMRRATRETNGFTLVGFPVRIGEHQRLNDGVLGFWLEDAAQRLTSPYHGVGADQIPLTQAIDTPSRFLTLLLDPRGTVQATCGVVPTRSLSIPAEMYRPALEKMAVSFFTAPLLTDAGQIAMPLPNEPGSAWSWQQQGPAGWSQTADPQQPDQRIPAQPTLREGWLTLRPVPDQGT